MNAQGKTNITDEELSPTVDEYNRLLTENQKLKADLAQITQQLPRLRQLIEYSADAMILHDSSGMIVDCNQYGAEMLAMDRDDVYEAPLTRFLGDLTHLMFEQIDEKPEGTRAKFMGSLLRNDDVSLPIEIHITAFTSNGERLYVSSIRDVSDRLQLASELSDMQTKLTLANVELSRANQRLSHMATLKDQFLANMSHELRTPLNAVLGLSEALQEEVYGPITPKQRESLQTIFQSGEHLLDLINDILDLSKIEADKMELHLENISIKEICNQVIPLVKSQANAKEQRLHFSCLGNVDIIQVDPRRMKQILINLLSNAVKFTPKGGNVGIEITAFDIENKISITVWDTGKGIADNQRELLFEPFVQLDGDFARYHEGTGLGLALVSRLVEMHDGRIDLQSEVNKGSRFTIHLPLRNEGGVQNSDNNVQYTDKLNIEQHSNIPISPNTVSKTRILIIEDTPENIPHVQDYLERQGYQIDIAVDGLKGVAKAQELLPDIILMDIQMPDINGFEAIEILRNQEQTQNILIIATTALAMDNDRQLCMDAGADAYLAKPYGLKELEALINDLYSRAKDN